MSQDRTTSLQVVLKKCIAWDEEFKNRFVNRMFEHELISEDKKNQIAELKEKDQVEQITKLIAGFVTVNTATYRKLKDFLHDSKVDTAVISLVTVVVESDLSNLLVELIEKWDALVQSEMELKKDIVDLDSTYRNLDNPWPLNFIQHCAKSENQDFLKKLCNHGKAFQALFCTTPESKFPDEGLYDDVDLDKDLDGNPDSFCVISEHEFDMQIDGYNADAPETCLPSKFDDSSFPGHQSESNSDSDHGDMDVVENLIVSAGDHLLPFVKLAWPEDSALFGGEQWSANLIATLNDADDPELCQRFIEICKWLSNLTREGTDVEVMSSWKCQSAKSWISSTSAEFMVSEERKSAFTMLSKLTWPNLEEFQIETIPNFLDVQYQKSEERVTDFVNAAQVFLELLKKNEDTNDKTGSANGEVKSILGEKTSLGVCETKNSDALLRMVSQESNSDSDHCDMDVAVNLIESAGDHLLPFVKLAWPEDPALVSDEHRSANLIATLYDADDPELCQRFIEICKWLSNLTREGTDFEVMSSWKSQLAESWISSTSAEFMVSEKRKIAFTMLFKLTWPNIEIFQTEIPIPNLLNDQYQKDEERTTDFVHVAQVFLELLKLSDSGTAGIEENVDQFPDPNLKVSFFESRLKEITQSRYVLLPFVKIFWPEHDRILDEETWPEELVAVANSCTSSYQLSFVDICKDVLEMKKDIGPTGWPKSANSKVARDWIITISDRIELLSKWSFHIDKLLHVTWPELESLSVSIHGWTRALLEKHRCDDARTRDFVSAAQMFYALIKAQASKTDFSDADEKREPSSSHADVKENSRCTILKDYYDDIYSAKNLLLPIIELMYPKKSELIEDGNWPNELVATVIENNEPVCEIFVSVLQHILDMKKAVPEYVMEQSLLEVSEVYKWLSKKTRVLNELDEETPFFHRLYQIAWPNRNEVKIKARQIGEFIKKDPDRTLAFGRAVKMFLPLKQKFQKKEKAAIKKSKDQEKNKTSHDSASITEKAIERPPCVQTKHGDQLEGTAAIDPQRIMTRSSTTFSAKHLELRKKETASSASTTSLGQAEEKVPGRTPSGQTTSSEQVEDFGKSNTGDWSSLADSRDNRRLDSIGYGEQFEQADLKENRTPGTATTDPQRIMTRSLITFNAKHLEKQRKTTASGASTKSLGQAKEKATGRAPSVQTIISEQVEEKVPGRDPSGQTTSSGQVEGEYFINLQVAVEDGHDNIYVKICGEHFRLDKYRNNIYRIRLETQQTSIYNYYIVHKSQRHYENCDERLVTNQLSGENFVYDVAVWRKVQYYPLHLMKLHLPTSLSSNIIIPVYYWLKQMCEGWRFMSRQTLYINWEVTEEVIISWLQSLSLWDRIFGTLSILVAMKKLRCQIREEMLRNLLIGMRIGFMNVMEHEKLYHCILSEFVTEFRSTSDISTCLLDVLKQLLDQDPSALLALPLYLLLKYDHELIKKAQTKFRNLTLLPSSQGMDLLENLELGDCEDKVKKQSYQKWLRDLHSTISPMCSATPAIATPYQRLLTPHSLVTLLVKDSSPILNFFRLDWVLEDVLAYLNEKPNEIDETLPRIKKHFVERLQEAEAWKLTEDEITKIIRIMIGMLKTLQKALKNAESGKKKIILFCAYIGNLITNWSSRLANQSLQSTCDKVYEMANGVINHFMEKLDIDIFKESDIEVCNELLSFEWNGGLQSTWIQRILDKTRNLIDQLQTWSDEQDEKYFKFFCEHIMGLDLQEDLMTCFNEKALISAQKLMRSEKSSLFWRFFCIPLPTIFSKDQKSKIIVFERLFMEEFEKYEKIPGQSTTQQILQFVCAWPISTQFFEVFHTPVALDCLSHAKEKIKKVWKTCSEFLKSIDDETIIAQDLKLFENVENRRKICDFLNFVQKKEQSTHGTSTERIEETIYKFMKKKSHFESERDEVEAFFKMCGIARDYEVYIDYEEIRNLYRGIEKPKTIKELFTVEDAQADPRRYCGLSKQDFDEFQLMKTVEKSIVMIDVWKDVTKKFKLEKKDGMELHLSWREALRMIWTVVKNDIIMLIDSTLCGTITLPDVTKRFERVAKNQNDLFAEAELIFCFYRAVTSVEELEISSKRLTKQLNDVFEISKSSMALRWVLAFKETQKLHGDFESLESILDENVEMTLADIDETTPIKFPDELRNMATTNLNILQYFLEQRELIAWLKARKTTDVSEIKVMCDLILASAGETPIETDRVMHLLNATQCFAPLLFHLDEVNSLEELLKRCEVVWLNVERDTNIRQKWEDSGKQVHWFDEKVSLYGSEQKDSLAYAQEINESGVYTVGRLKEERPTLENSVLLTLRSSEKSPQKRKKTEEFNLNKLQDLQSKLALLAGEGDGGQQDIAQFVDLFSMVKTLAEAFINLTEAGCMLFSDWNAIITTKSYKTTDRQNEHNLTLSIQFAKSGAATLAGTASLSVLQELSKTLRLANEQWTEYISSKRLQHYYLNEYSMQQITYLCKELATTNNIASLPDQVLALLSNNSKNLVAGELQDALDEATKVDTMTNYDADSGSESMQENQQSLTELEKKKRVIRKLVNNDDIDENLAKASVQAKGYESIDDCLTWAMLNEFKVDEVTKFLALYNEECVYALQSNEEEEMTSILQNRSNYSLTEMIAQILKTSQTQETIKIVGAVKTICSRYFEKTSMLTMRDYLSVEHLGKFLSILGGKGKLQTTVQRDIIDVLHSGSPNMIICPEVDMLTILLSLYMTDPEQPLPTASEVLLCCEQTSADEVERFMRRAMCKSNTNGSPLFCMAFTDKLKFKISKALEDIFEKLQQQQQHLNEKYQLVFLTSMTQHYISEYFDKYHIPGKPNHEKKADILEYLQKHLSSDETLTGSEISSVVQVVVSNRSGVGKSLYVKKLSNQIDSRWYEGPGQTPLMQLFIRVLSRPEMPAVNRELPQSLKRGKVNFITCEQNDSLNVLLGIYMNNAKEPRPTIWEVLVCCQQTSDEEVEQFFRRAMCKVLLKDEQRSKHIFTLSFGERLQPKVAERLREIHENLSANMHCKKDYMIVVINGNIQYFDWCEQFKPTRNSLQGDEQNLSAYLREGVVPEGYKLVLTNSDSVVGNDDTSSPADLVKPGIWRKTTIRLLEKSIDTDHTLEQLYREDHFRNEDSHFIHIDLTPAVEDGIERFMFNLLILGSIQDSEGNIWNRQKQHIYVVEMTKSKINEHQIHENSILNILPHITCLSPQETLGKLKNVKLKTRTVLKEHLIQSQEEASSKIAMLNDCLEGDYEYSLDDFQHVRQDNQSINDCVMDLLQLSGFPLQITLRLMQLLTSELRTILVNIYKEESLHTLCLMDYEEFISTTFQRPYQYLKHASLRDIKLDNFQYCQPGGTPEDCLEVLLKSYVSPNPNWAQLKHFASFLNVQLQNCEECVFCQKVAYGKSSAYRDTGLKGLKDFAVNFMIRMSQDFATPSLVTADESGQDLSDQANSRMAEGDVIDAHQLRRKWEEKCHPYVFFNEDRSMSFINVDINRHGDLLDVDGKVLIEKVADKNLVVALKTQGVEFGINFHKKTRKEKLDALRTIMGLSHSEVDPDYTYELTTDNALKILAIYMRLRCGIPVIVMGETGCGKTRMVEFMSKLRAGNKHEARNMVTLKIHGGLNASDIYKSVKDAASFANKNTREGIDTVLFYDEANTTRAIYAIKEVVCDNTINGVSFSDNHLQIVAACNPYKRLSDKAITTLENSGLGYRVSASQTTDCLGEIPMRRLVYKVVALPPSMHPFVWDFGQLSTEIEKKYIDQMTIHLQKDLRLSNSEKELVDFVFCEAQTYMKESIKDECRYVSLRDVERCMKVFCFFHGLVQFLRKKIENNLDLEIERDAFTCIPDTLLCLIQTIGVCYHVSLDKGRRGFREHMSERLSMRGVHINASALNNQLIACQKVFLSNIRLERTIAPNEALRENVYLIAICCQLQIPLFVVGKPGSSKSLAKTVVADNMRGQNSHSDLFRKMKQIYTVTYQCSALTNAAGIETVFRQCADFQKKEDNSTFSAVVVLDEIGLAEDSPNMPLKVLHPLLECGCTESGTITDIEPKQKVGFVGISNWALDPAKMNRGIFVTRSTPNKEDLLATANSIMQKEIRSMEAEQEVLKTLTKSYLDIYNNSQGVQATKEYFGLRDYYSLIKMVSAKSASKEKCEFKDVAYAAQRNFSGGHESHFEQLTSAVQPHYEEEIPEKTSVKVIIKDNLSERNSRFLLLLTGQHSSVSLLQHLIPNFWKKVQVIFGSSFPGDHTYTEICKNINRIKICMESGRTVVLLNLTEIHESLYDALNQHYMIYGGQRYVDIGLGSHRIKCRVSDDFRLIVMEHRDKVYREYPIPLINRLEKHHLSSQYLLSDDQEKLSKSLSAWCKIYSSKKKFSEKDAFVGYYSDTPSSVVLSQNTKRDLTTCKHKLLQSATPDAVYRAIKHDSTSDENRKLLEVYTENQVHDSLLNLLMATLEKCEKMVSLMTVTSFSSILTEKDRRKMEECLKLSTNSIMLMSLQQFDTQQEYYSKLEKFFDSAEDRTHSRSKILMIQCSQAQKHGELLACAKYCVMNMLKNLQEKDSPTIIAFLLSTRRQNGIVSNCQDQVLLQHTEACDIIYVDDLRPVCDTNTVVSEFYGKTLTDILKIGSDKIKNKIDKGSQFLVWLKESVCQAMAKLKRQNVMDDRYIKCIDCLTRLFDLDDEISHRFCLSLSEHMKHIYFQRDEDLSDFMEDWKVKEACSAENLQEGGSFGKTLVLCLKRHLANLLAFIISCVDENNNLEILYNYERQLQPSTWKVELWLNLFEHYTMEWKSMKPLKEFSVQFNSHLAKSFSPCFPFSFKLISFFNAVWSTNKEGSQEQRSIFSQFETTQESKTISPFYEKYEDDMAEAFATDLIKCNFDHDETLKFLPKILLSISRKLKDRLTLEEEFRNVRGIAILYYSFRSYNSHLHMLHEIIKICPEMTKNIDEWIKLQEPDREFNIHGLAMKYMLEWVRTFSIEDDTSCIQWMDLTSKCKKIFLPNIHLIDQHYQNKVRQIWDPISLLDLFLLQLLPGSEEKSFENYVKVVVNHSKRLHKPLQSFGFCNETFLKILLNVLRKSYEDIELKLLISWQNLSCKMCRKKFIGPVKLPCGHFICEGCVDSMLAAAEMRRKCPLCPASIAQEFVPARACLSTEATNQLKKFKSNCTSFFLEYLNKFFFDVNTPQINNQTSGNAEEIHIRAKLILDEFVIGVTDDRPSLETRAIDMNVSTKSCILRCLLGKDKEYITSVIDSLLKSTSLSAKDKQWENLVLIILVGCEGSLHKLQTYETFKGIWEEVKITNDVTLKLLSDIAKLRHTLQGYISEICEKLQAHGSELWYLIPNFRALVPLCKNDGSNILGNFATKFGCQRFGTSWLNYVLADKYLEDLVTKEIKNETKDELVDHFLLIGQKYTDVRDGLDRGSLEALEQPSTECLSKKEIFHKRVSKITAAVKFSNDLGKLLHCMEKGNEFEWLHAIANSFNEGINKLTTKQNHEVKELVILTGCLALCEPHLFHSLYLLLTMPSECENLFLPAMPTSLFFSFQEALQRESRIAMYTCPKGHPYVIGECTKPWQESECLECGAVIGGKLHVAAENNQRIEMSEESYMGYLLNASDLLGKDDPCDRMSKQGVAVVHCILHCCMLIGLEHDTGSICRMLNKDSKENSKQYLCMKISENITDLSKAIGRNCDDSVIIIHACLNYILLNGFDIEEDETDWNTMGNRAAWETQFRKRYLLPVFRDLDYTLAEAQQRLNTSENFRHSHLHRLLHEVASEEQPREYTWSHPAFWRTIKHPNAAHLLQFVADSSSAERVLKVILDTPGLDYLQHLEEVLRLQRIFISRYQNTIDLKQAESITFDEYLIEPEGCKNRKLVQKYIIIWNMIIRKGLPQLDKLPKEYLQRIDERSSIAMALPSSRGRGKCAKLLAELMIDIHNNFLQKCFSIIKTSNGSNEVDIQLLGSNHFICIDKKRDLLPLIRMHTAYTITSGDESNIGPQHRITYNVEALEKQIREKYVVYKPLINKKSLPCITYSQDIGIGTDWNRVIDNIPQEPLPSKLIQEVDGLMADQNVTPADICEGVRTLTHAISFLARIKTEAGKTLKEYLKENLLLPSNHMAMIPKSVLISQTLALYQRLMWRKAVNFVQQGLNPYEEALSKADQEDIQDHDVLERLENGFEHMDMNLFQQRLNEILIQVPDYNPNWSLRENIFPYVDFIEGNTHTWYEQIPEEICFKHISHLFQLAVRRSSTTN